MDKSTSVTITAEDRVYTHAMWRVKKGQEKAFIKAWVNLAETFAQLEDPPVEGRLIQSISDSTLFYSFGPWRRLTDVEAMREDRLAQEAFQAVQALCEKVVPDTYRLVRRARL